MFNKYISTNKHEWNVRMVEEYNVKIQELKNKLKKENTFLGKLKLKSQTRKLSKKLSVHGNEVLLYEYNNRG